VRTTLTLDDDVEAKLRSEARRTGQSFKQVVNEALRESLQRRTRRASTPFKVKPKDLGELRPGMSLDNIGELLEQLEGSSHR
jgi:predicted transcriptional regulator